VLAIWNGEAGGQPSSAASAQTVNRIGGPERKAQQFVNCVALFISRRSNSLVTTGRRLSGVAPRNFGAALGYGAVSVDASATSHALIADSRSTAAH
jgi:hypothetical protein